MYIVKGKTGKSLHEENDTVQYYTVHDANRQLLSLAGCPRRLNYPKKNIIKNIKTACGLCRQKVRRPEE